MERSLGAASGFPRPQGPLWVGQRTLGRGRPRVSRLIPSQGGSDTSVRLITCKSYAKTPMIHGGFLWALREAENRPVCPCSVSRRHSPGTEKRAHSRPESRILQAIPNSLVGWLVSHSTFC